MKYIFPVVEDNLLGILLDINMSSNAASSQQVEWLFIIKLNLVNLSVPQKKNSQIINYHDIKQSSNKKIIWTYIQFNKQLRSGQVIEIKQNLKQTCMQRANKITKQMIGILSQSKQQMLKEKFVKNQDFMVIIIFTKFINIDIKNNFVIKILAHET